jgi:hypothetical protein
MTNFGAFRRVLYVVTRAKHSVMSGSEKSAPMRQPLIASGNAL